MRYYIIITLYIIGFYSLHADNEKDLLFFKQQSKVKGVFNAYLQYGHYYTRITGNGHVITLYGYPQLHTYVADRETFTPVKLTLTLPGKGCRCIYKCQNASGFCFVYDHDQAIVLFYPPCGFANLYPNEGDKVQDDYDDVINTLKFNNDVETFTEWNMFNIFFYTPNSKPYYVGNLKKGRKNYYLYRQQFVIVALNLLPWNYDLFKAYIDNTFTILSNPPTT